MPQAHTPDTNRTRFGRMESNFMLSRQNMRDGSDDAGSRGMTPGRKNGGLQREVTFNEILTPGPAEDGN